MVTNELEEIAHSGGKVTLTIRDADGRRSYQVGYSHSNPTPAAVVSVYAIPQGVAVAELPMAGIGAPWPQPPVPGCYPVFICSDSTGMFGAQCPSCNQYWRHEGGVFCCPYCGIQIAGRHLALTEGQRRFVSHFCDTLNEALASAEPGVHQIDIDAVVDLVGKGHPKPPFYHAEERQQNLFVCIGCGARTDVLGRFAYCGTCGTRNDLAEFHAVAQAIRNRINSGESLEACARDAVAAFDSVAAQYASQMIQHVPLTPARRAKIDRGPYHNIQRVIESFRDVFDINLVAGMSDDDIAFLTLMFHRRHVYEHNGGEADETYLRDSKDSVRLKQALRETKESAHRAVAVISKVVENLHKGFHSLFPPRASAIEAYVAVGRKVRPRAH